MLSTVKSVRAALIYLNSDYKDATDYQIRLYIKNQELKCKDKMTETYRKLLSDSNSCAKVFGLWRLYGRDTSVD